MTDLQNIPFQRILIDVLCIASRSKLRVNSVSYTLVNVILRCYKLIDGIKHTCISSNKS